MDAGRERGGEAVTCKHRREAALTPKWGEERDCRVLVHFYACFKKTRTHLHSKVEVMENLQSDPRGFEHVGQFSLLDTAGLEAC